MNKAVVLLSGGLDSSTTLGIADKRCDEIYALTFRYGQKHDKEVECAKQLCEHYSAKEHLILKLPLKETVRSSLLKNGEKIPEHLEEEIGEEIPSTYVPARNILFLSYALSYAESIDADAIYIGATAQDYSGYPDCRAEFFDAFRKVVKKGTKRGVENDPIKIRTPVLNMSKKEIVLKGSELGVPFDQTWSCYKGGRKACGECDSCKLRLQAFKKAGSEDPIEYEKNQ